MVEENNAWGHSQEIMEVQKMYMIHVHPLDPVSRSARLAPIQAVHDHWGFTSTSSHLPPESHNAVLNIRSTVREGRVATCTSN